MNRFAIALASATALAAAFVAAAPVGAHATGNVWARDDGRQGNTILLQREFAGCHMLEMGSVPPRDFGSDWAAQMSFNIEGGGAINAIMDSACVRKAG
jgi:hypothetical protein